MLQRGQRAPVTHDLDLRAVRRACRLRQDQVGGERRAPALDHRCGGGRRQHSDCDARVVGAQQAAQHVANTARHSTEY
eukprot:scaffold38028_cov79-Phaeocystis_antarctica.AAC.3